MEEKKIKDCIANIKSFKVMMSSLFGQISGYSDIESALEELTYNFDNCLFQVGDRVKLCTTPVIDKYTHWGWLAHKHFMIEGAKATVQSRGIHKGKFRYGVTFDEESYIHYETKQTTLVSLDKKSIFVVPESWIIRA